MRRALDPAAAPTMHQRAVLARLGYTETWRREIRLRGEECRTAQDLVAKGWATRRQRGNVWGNPRWYFSITDEGRAALGRSRAGLLTIRCTAEERAAIDALALARGEPASVMLRALVAEETARRVEEKAVRAASRPPLDAMYMILSKTKKGTTDAHRKKRK